jgi:hypothetical protein
MIAMKAHLYGKLKTLGEQLHMNVPTEVSLTSWRHNCAFSRARTPSIGSLRGTGFGQSWTYRLSVILKIFKTFAGLLKS